jgi:hypothetical protein
MFRLGAPIHNIRIASIIGILPEKRLKKKEKLIFITLFKFKTTMRDQNGLNS